MCESEDGGGPKKNSGFEDDFDHIYSGSPLCKHPNHQPPSHLVIPAGKKYRHVCPGCGREVVIRSHEYFNSSENRVVGIKQWV